MRARPWPITWASEREPRGRPFRAAGLARRGSRDQTTTTVHQAIMGRVLLKVRIMLHASYILF